MSARRSTTPIAVIGCLAAAVGALLSVPSWLVAALGGTAGLLALGLAVAARRAGGAAEAELADVVRALDRGDLTTTEDSDLGRAVAGLAARLRPLTSLADALAIAGQEMAVAGATVSDGVLDTSRSASTITGASVEVSAKVAAMASSGHELQAAIVEVSRSAQQAVESATAGVQRVEAAVVTMNALEESSERVGNIVKTISSIADQTNLLALNATIEAARAGAAGKGFAVVAAEVKDLASETARATDEISQTVTQIRSDAAAAISAISSVREVIDSISAFQHSIASAVEEQTVTTGALTSTTAEISTQAEAIASSVGVVADRASATSKAATSNHLAVSELTRLVGDLRGALEHIALPAPELVPGTYSIEWNRAANRLDIVMSGDWDLEVAAAYARDSAAAFRQSRPGWQIIADMRLLGPTTPAVQELIEGTMADVQSQALDYCVLVVANPLLAMQMQRSSEAQGAPIGYTASIPDAVALLATR